MNRDFCKDCEIYRVEQKNQDRGEYSACVHLIMDFVLFDAKSTFGCKHFIQRKDENRK